MKKPVIGITPSHNTDNDEISVRPTYLRAIEAAGGLSILLPHKQPYSCCLPSHHVDVQRDTLLCGIADGKTQIEVNSSHHQAVRRIAPCLIASGHAPDGIIEALEMPDYPYLLALQWHPEYMWKTDTVSANIFKSFVEACRG